jgi:hypothetical protein
MIDQNAAIEIARKRAEEKGWGFAEPLHIVEHRGWRKGITRFEIWTNGSNRGTKARFTVDAKTGEIIEEGYIPR